VCVDRIDYAWEGRDLDHRVYRANAEKQPGAFQFQLFCISGYLYEDRPASNLLMATMIRMRRLCNMLLALINFVFIVCTLGMRKKEKLCDIDAVLGCWSMRGLLLKSVVKALSRPQRRRGTIARGNELAEP
jgi:hypothetical protein